MTLIAAYRNAGYAALADGVIAFFDRRSDLQRPGVAFGPGGAGDPAKVSTDISLVAIDRSDPEAFALAEVIVRGVSAGLDRLLETALHVAEQALAVETRGDRNERCRRLEQAGWE
ncbi:MAG: hypothetical protein ACKOPS_00630, partial [Cyanobium sp.]